MTQPTSKQATSISFSSTELGLVFIVGDDSGKIHFITSRAKELGVSTYEYIFNPKLLEEVNQQYGCKITRSTFWIKYQEYLEA